MRICRCPVCTEVDRTVDYRCLRLGTAGRFRWRMQISAFERGLALLRIRKLHPEAGKRECLMRYASIYLSVDPMGSAFGWDPEAHGD